MRWWKTQIHRFIQELLHLYVEIQKYLFSKRNGSCKSMQPTTFTIVLLLENTGCLLWKWIKTIDWQQNSSSLLFTQHSRILGIHIKTFSPPEWNENLAQKVTNLLLICLSSTRATGLPWVPQEVCASLKYLVSPHKCLSRGQHLGLHPQPITKDSSSMKPLANPEQNSTCFQRQRSL